MKKIIAFCLCLTLVMALGISAFADNSGSASTQQTNACWQIIGSNVNFRAGPGFNYSVVGLVQYGDTFVDYGISQDASGNNWRYCGMTSGSHYGEAGYVASQYTDYR